MSDFQFICNQQHPRLNASEMSVGSTDNSSSCHPAVERELPDEYSISSALQMYVSPSLVAVGVLGNLLAFVTFLKSLRRGTKSTELYLCVLSAVDALVLMTGLFRLWLVKLTGMPVLDGFHWGCKISNFILYSSTWLSVWLIVAVTYDRFMAVKYPLLVKTICTISRARKVIAAIVALAVAVNGHFFFSLESRHYPGANNSSQASCQPVANFHSFLFDVWPFIDASLYSLVPCSILLVLNPSIIYHIKVAKRHRNITLSKDSRQIHSQRVAMKKIPVMVLLMSFTFIVSTIPMSVLIVFQTLSKGDDATEHVDIMVLLRTIAELLMYFHHAANCYLYCASSNRFRYQCFRHICGVRRNRAASRPMPV